MKKAQEADAVARANGHDDLAAAKPPPRKSRAQPKRRIALPLSTGSTSRHHGDPISPLSGPEESPYLDEFPENPVVSSQHQGSHTEPYDQYDHPTANQYNTLQYYTMRHIPPQSGTSLDGQSYSQQQEDAQYFERPPTSPNTGSRLTYPYQQYYESPNNIQGLPAYDIRRPSIVYRDS